MESTTNENEEKAMSETFSKEENENLLFIGDNLSSKSSLQDNFAKFRKQKIKERQIMKLCQTVTATGGRSESFKEELRTKFVNAAKKYLGVPYAQRYKAESDPVAPLYLDCCALVRQAVQDLQDEFGFIIGRWNQAYQMDTLPIVLTQEQMKPGDLIFYEGLYNSSRSKSQKHNNVHVEIFLGGETGEATIGSRYHRGKVSIFDSYKFKSTTWDLVQYHFRSLDTWLDGVCRSCCPEHLWQSDSLNYVEAAGKRSIFSEDHDDESAGGEEDEEVQQGGGDGEDIDDTTKDNGVKTTVANTFDAEHGGDGDKNTSAEVIESITAEVNSITVTETPPTATTTTISHTNITTTTTDITSTTTATNSKTGSKQPLVRRKSAAETVLASEKAHSSGTSSATSAKLLPKRSASTNKSTNLSVDGTKTVAAVNISTAQSPSQKIKETSKSLTSVDNSSKSGKVSSKDIPRTYYVGKTNGWKLVKAAMDKRGWQQLPFEYQFSTRFGLKWVERRSDIDYRTHVPGQLVCHIPNNDIITTKIGILTVLRDKFCKQPIGSGAKIHAPWVPETYDLDTPADCIALIQAATEMFNQNAVKNELKVSGSQENDADVVTSADTTQGIAGTAEEITSGVWIYKPSCYNRGRGIKVVTGIDALKEICYGKQTGDPDTTIAPMKGIVQKYIENPLLVSTPLTPRLKFDIRCYMLIARNFPTTLAFYHPGYCRLALKSYDISSVSALLDPSVHLTNASVQKKDPIYEANKELQIQSILSVAQTIEESGNVSSANYLRNDLDNQIKLCMVDVLKASNHKLIRKHGYFDLLGCDFMLSEDNKLYLLEINTNPALSLDNSTLENLLPGVVDGAIELVLAGQGPEASTPPIGANDDTLLQNIPEHFQLLFNEEKNWFYGGDSA